MGMWVAWRNDWNTGILPVRPADMLSAEGDSGLQTRWPHRLKVCVPQNTLHAQGKVM